MLVLTRTLGEYSDRNEKILAVSNDKAKLEAKIQTHLANAKLRVKVYDEASAEYRHLADTNPFSEAAPPRRLPKPDKELRTKEEQDQRRQARQEVERVYKDWTDRELTHQHDLWQTALNNARAANGVKDDMAFCPFDRYFSGPDYYYRNMNESNFNIIEVEEL